MQLTIWLLCPCLSNCSTASLNSQNTNTRTCDAHITGFSVTWTWRDLHSCRRHPKHLPMTSSISSGMSYSSSSSACCQAAFSLGCDSAKLSANERLPRWYLPQYNARANLQNMDLSTANYRNNVYYSSRTTEIITNIPENERLVHSAISTKRAYLQAATRAFMKVRPMRCVSLVHSFRNTVLFASFKFNSFSIFNTTPAANKSNLYNILSQRIVGLNRTAKTYVDISIPTEIN